MTDGMIVRELMSDPLLLKYSVIIVDEAHERTLRTDLLLANLKGIQQRRNAAEDVKGKGRADKMIPLKIIVMSATLDAEKFSKFFHKQVHYAQLRFPTPTTSYSAKIIYVRGRQHPVTIYHSVESQVDYIDAAMRTFFQVHLDQSPGDVLIFLPGPSPRFSCPLLILISFHRPRGHWIPREIYNFLLQIPSRRKNGCSRPLNVCVSISSIQR